MLLSNKEDNGHQNENAGGDEVGRPVSVVTREERRGDGTTGSEIDGGVEPHVDTLDSDGRRLNYDLPGRESLCEGSY